MIRRVFSFAVLASLSVFAASPAQAESLTDGITTFLDNHHVPFPPPEVPLASLYIQYEGATAPVRVIDVILQPPHVGATMGPKLQLPPQISVSHLVRGAKALRVFDLNGDDALERSELTQALLTWAVTSEADKPFGKASFFYNTDAGMTPISYFVLNYDDSAYVRRCIVQHGRVGSADLLNIIDEES